MKTLIANPRSAPDLPIGCCTPIAGPNLSDREARDAATLFKALADPHRVRIVNVLANADEPVCVCDFQTPLRLAQGTVSFHLRKLLDAGVIEREQRGTWAYYSLRPYALSRLGEVF